jgi:hypothetical protein
MQPPLHYGRGALVIAAKSQLSGKILLTDRRATIRTVLQVVYFLRKKKRARCGVFFSIPIHNLTQSKNILSEKYATHDALEDSHYLQRLICHVQKDMDGFSFVVLAMSALYFKL